MKLRSRLGLTLLVAMFSFALISWILEHRLLTLYLQKLRRSSAETMLLVAKSVEQNLKEIEGFSFSVMKDEQLQRELFLIQSESVPYSRKLLSDSISERLFSLVFSQESVSNVTIVDSQGSLFSSDLTNISFQEEFLEDAIETAKQGKGKHTWVFASQYPVTIYSIREVRRIAGLQLSYLGTVIISTEIGELIEKNLKLLGAEKIDLAIVTKDEVVFPGMEKTLESQSHFRLGDGSGSTTLKINGETFFTTYVQSSYLGWTYLMLVPYQQITGDILVLGYQGLVALAIVFLLALVLGFRLLKNCTEPLESLARRMKEVETHEFREIAPPLKPNSYPHEIGVLYREFTLMLNRIDGLMKESKRRESAIAESRFQALQAQMNPHFLYNALESVNSIAKVQGQTRISQIVKSLGNLLRSSISDKSQNVTIEYDIRLVMDYLRIQEIRFGERLRASVSVSQKIYGYTIPKLTLQPIVENSIQYGLEARSGPCRIEIAGKEESSGLVCLSVSDDGPGMSPETIAAVTSGRWRQRYNGISLKNIDDRLKIMFGDRYGLRIISEMNSGTSVRILIPPIKPSTIVSNSVLKKGC